MDDVQEPVTRIWRDEIDAAAAKRCESAIDEIGQLPVFDGTVQKILKAVDGGTCLIDNVRLWEGK